MERPRRQRTFEERKRLQTFYALLITQTFSLLGSRMSAFAIGIWVFRQTGDVTPLALVAFFETVPMIALGNIAGMLADRLDRRRLMILAGSGQALGSLLLLLSFLSGHFQIWHLYSIALLQAIFGVFHQLAFGASVTMLVPDDQRDRANAIRQLCEPLASSLAPAVTGILYTFLGVSGIVAIDLFTFVVAVLAIMGVTIPRPTESAESRALRTSIWREVAGGIRYLWSRRTLFWLIVFAAVINFGFMIALVLATPYILVRTGSESTLGLLLTVMSIGAILGSLVMGAWGGTRPRIHTILPGVMISAIALALYGISRTPLLIGVTLFLMMFPLPFVNAAMTSLLQVKVPPDLQGRVTAVVMQISLLLTPLAYLIAGPLVDNVFEPAVGRAGWSHVAALVGEQTGAGMGLLILISGMTVFILSLLVYALPAIRRMEANLPDYQQGSQDESQLPERSQLPETPELITA